MQTLAGFLGRVGLLWAFGLGASVLAGGEATSTPLTTSFSSEWPPYRLQSVTGWSGLDIDLTQAIFDRAGLKWTTSLQPTIRGLEALKHGELDFLMSATPTPDRREYAWFSQPYRREVIALLGKKGVGQRFPFRSLEEVQKFPDLRFAAERGGFFGVAFTSLLNNPSQAWRVDLTNDLDQRFAMLEADRVQLLVDDQNSLADYARKKGLEFEFHPVILSESPQSLMFSKATTSPALIKRIDQAIDILRANGILARIQESYLH